jgi:FkbM family methyltransferase
MIIFKPHELLSHIVPYLPVSPVIVEAGAFTGSDSIRLAKQWQQGTVHAFEPVPELYKKLQHNTQPYANIHTYNYALSSQTGSALFYLSEKEDKPGKSTQAGSLHAPKERLHLSPIVFPTTVQVPTITLPVWARQYGMSHVDLLWLDLQGHELAVMQAAEHMLDSVRVIFTEVAFVEAYENQPTMQQIIDFLQPRGFTLIGRDFADMPAYFFGNLLFARI